MKITYIKHSSFLAEWEDVACLFDYSEGTLPKLDPKKKLFIFASHAHSDHYTDKIYELCAAHPRHMFILSDDILPSPGEKSAVVHRMGPDRRRILNGGSCGAVSVTTLGSTDCGVAFIVNYAGKTVYHAGDLHWWAWPDDSTQEERDMKSRFFAEIAKIKGIRLDAAFLPLDPRLGGNYWMGFDAVMRTANIEKAFPMHMWDKLEYIPKLRKMGLASSYADRICEIRAPGQVFDI